MPRIKTTSEKINGWKIVQKFSDPDALRAKGEIRRNVLEYIGADRAHVFDAFAGEGGMYREAWQHAASCVGCDHEVFAKDDRLAYVADNCRVMRNLDLEPFNIFDFDAFGSPWEPIYVMIHRRVVRPGELVGVVITEGQGMKMDMGGMSGALSLVAGVLQYARGMGAQQQAIVDRALLRMARMMNATIVKQWQTMNKKSSTIRYIGLVLKGAERA